MIHDDCPYTQQDSNHCHCGNRLTGRQRRYCSRQCSRDNRNNHRWTQARAEALEKATWYACAHCEHLFQRHDIQVNHIIPCLGKHSIWGCHHHQSNLEVLCKDCHATVTAEQRSRGDFG